MKVYCPECGAEVAADDLNLETLLARCRKCNNVFSFAEAGRAEVAAGQGRIPGREAAIVVGRPERIQVLELGNGWIAHWRWFTPKIIFMIFFCIAWDAFLIFWYAIALTKNGPWLMIVFPIAHVAAGVGITYYTIASLLNSTTIRLSRREFSISSGPIPWRGNQTLPATSIASVRGKIDTSGSNRFNYNRYGNGYNNYAAYGVFATLVDGRSIRLVGGLNDATEAGFLQQQMEKHLNIRPSALPADA